MLLLEAYLEDVDPETLASGIYAVVHSPLDGGQALKWDGSSYVLDDYAKADHADFAIPLIEHSERSFYYRYGIPAGEGLVLPATTYGEEYTVEIWESVGSGGYDRDVDDLRETSRFKWSGTRRIDAYLDVSQENHEVFAGAGYSVSTQVLKITAWLERCGALVNDPTTCYILIKDRTDTTLLELTNSSPDGNGIFQFNGTGLAFEADDSLKFIVRITDGADEIHESGGTLTIWD